MLDVIGDIHGHAEYLHKLLKLLGYRQNNGVYGRPDRKALFLGDLIDRGPDQLEVIRIVRSMVDAGNAFIIMGNHEYNAVAYVTPHVDKPGEYLRKNDQRNRKGHAAFLAQVGEGSARHKEIIGWFKTLPVMYQGNGIRAIHACWHSGSIQVAKPLLSHDLSITEEGWHAFHFKHSLEFVAMETLLKGMEVELPAGVSFKDKDGHIRKRTRTEWWIPKARTYAEICNLPNELRETLPDMPIDESKIIRYQDPEVVFIGHYWMQGNPMRLTPKIACLDYSIAVGDDRGKLCAYRWNGEDHLVDTNFIWVNGKS